MKRLSQLLLLGALILLPVKGGQAETPEDPIYIVIGNGAKLQNDKDVLSAHAQWETNYWRQHASRVESNNRADLIGTRKDVKVTEIRVYNDKGAQLSSYLIGLAAEDGIFALSLSPATKDIDPLVKELVSLFKLVPRNLDAEETKRLSSEAKAQR